MSKVAFKRPPRDADEKQLVDYLNYLIDELTVILTSIDEENTTDEYEKER